MSSKPRDRKHDYISGGGTASYAVFSGVRKILDDPKFNMKENMKGESFHTSHASWRNEVDATLYGPRTAQQFLDTRNFLCSVSAFREEIIQIRNNLSSFAASLQSVAETICRNWRISNGKEWVTWLITHWDPAATQYPPIGSPIPPDSFPPWTIERHYLQQANGEPGVCRGVTITLNAGVSGREAHRITELAHKALDRSIRKIGRPRLSDLDIETLRAEFVKLGIPKPQQRAAMTRKVQKACVRSDNRRFSTTFIGKQLRQWLREQKQTVRQYVTEPTSRRPKPS